MSELPFALSRRVEQRVAALAGGVTLAPMAAGPKWVCQLVAEAPAPGQEQLAAARPWLATLRPLNVPLQDWSDEAAAALVCSARDSAGRVGAYAGVGRDGAVEIVATLPCGLWSSEPCVWWPGSYEIPLLRQLDTVYAPLWQALRPGAPGYLCMSLLGMRGTALIAKGELGNERPYRLPHEIDTLALPPVQFETAAADARDALMAALDQVRAYAGVSPAHPFYL
ncbi:hypothetical protein [Pseudogulbenkiania subflava]|uniref:Uncharacterized protein n=1 Tax=Pseudogulbenkiania subflava DSM 22618 TaxID=1123014 RepID=A0A1Y6BGT8_9NEIS|nr:hypothetical protein [Pseudogulbenkiania subflava]SMF02831.1 hypothetical protein SAMN02745746_00835 [Pseudogulbenkiania subflava DSM 22618]